MLVLHVWQIRLFKKGLGRLQSVEARMRGVAREKNIDRSLMHVGTLEEEEGTGAEEEAGSSSASEEESDGWVCYKPSCQ